MIKKKEQGICGLREARIGPFRDAHDGFLREGAGSGQEWGGVSLREWGVMSALLPPVPGMKLRVPRHLPRELATLSESGLCPQPLGQTRGGQAYRSPRHAEDAEDGVSLEAAMWLYLTGHVPRSRIQCHVQLSSPQYPVQGSYRQEGED